MPNAPVAASATAFPAISRRAFVLKSAALSTVLAHPAPLAAMTLDADPMLELIREYRCQVAIYSAAPEFEDTDEELDFAAATFGPPYDRLKNNPSIPTTELGAIEAMKLALEEMSHSYGSFDEPVLQAVLAYFEGRAA